MKKILRLALAVILSAPLPAIACADEEWQSFGVNLNGDQLELQVYSVWREGGAANFIYREVGKTGKTKTFGSRSTDCTRRKWEVLIGSKWRSAPVKSKAAIDLLATACKIAMSS
jgi:hypothetical protein